MERLLLLVQSSCILRFARFSLILALFGGWQFMAGRFCCVFSCSLPEELRIEGGRNSASYKSNSIRICCNCMGSNNHLCIFKKSYSKSNSTGVHFEMTKIIKIVLLSAEIVSFALIGFCGLLGIIYEIAGFGVFEKILQAVGISHSLRFVWRAGAISVVALLGASYIRKKLCCRE